MHDKRIDLLYDIGLAGIEILKPVAVIMMYVLLQSIWSNFLFQQDQEMRVLAVEAQKSQNTEICDRPVHPSGSGRHHRV